MEETTGYCEIATGRLYYEQKGSGDVLTFCNGTAMDTRIWDDQYDELSHHFSILRFDNLGCGKSSDLPTTPHHYDDDLNALHDCLGITRSIVAGLSVGGGIALNYCLNYPERVSALVLMDTFMTGYQWPYTTPKMKILAEHWQRGDVDKTIEAWGSMEWFDHLKQDEEKYKRITPMVDFNARRVFSQEFPPKEDWGKPMIDRLGEVKVPTLLFIGEKDTPDNHEVMQIIHREVKQSKLVVVPDSGHVVNVENPSCVNQTIVEFFRELAAGNT